MQVDRFLPMMLLVGSLVVSGTIARGAEEEQKTYYAFSLKSAQKGLFRPHGRSKR